jgi:hypothetical protein
MPVTVGERATVRGTDAGMTTWVVHACPRCERRVEIHSEITLVAALFVAVVTGFPGGLFGWVAVSEFLSGMREDWKPGVILGAVALTVAGLCIWFGISQIRLRLRHPVVQAPPRMPGP